jgi:hypothetical protein
MSYIQVINKAIDDFIKNPYDENYEISTGNSLSQLNYKDKLCKNFRILKIKADFYNKLSNEKIDSINITRGEGDIVFALICDFDYGKLECKLIIDNNLINTFTVYPDKACFLLNGAPLILLNMTETKNINLKFYHNDIEVIPHNVEFYGANLEYDACNELESLMSKNESILCKLEDNKFYKIKNGKGEIIHDSNKYMFESKSIIV